MDCPKCRKPMDKVRFDTIEVDRCNGCQGLWFDALEAEDLKHVEGSENIDTGDPKRGEGWNEMYKIECPKCHTRMIQMVDIKHPHLGYEACKLCGGIFLDAGEFKDLKHETIGDFFRDLFGRKKK